MWRRNRMETVEASVPTDESVDWLAVRRLVRAEAKACRDEQHWLSPEAAERILRAAGIRLAGSGLATSPAEAVALAARLGGATGTVVMKAVVPGLLHKTEAGAVALGVGSAFVAATYELFDARFPTMSAVLVQEQLPDGVELLVGARQDPSAGPLVVVAAGGVEAELLADRVIRAAPLTVDEARTAVLALHTAPRLTGFRGRPVADVGAAALAVSRVSQLVATVPELVEFEINPIVIGQLGACAVDVRMRTDLGSNTVHPLRGN
jgi:succinyl-CoA synthetase beta subunit